MKRISVLLAVLGLSATVSFSAEWSPYFQDNVGKFRYDIDKDGMQRTPEGTIRVWIRLEQPSSAGKSVEEEWREVDCSHRKYRILERKSFTQWDSGDKSNPTVGKTTNWIDFEPYIEHLTLYEAVCGKGMKN